MSTPATTARAFLALTKPGITLFVGFTASAGFVTAQRGLHSAASLIAPLLATMLMSAGAAALNG